MDSNIKSNNKGQSTKIKLDNDVKQKKKKKQKIDGNISLHEVIKAIKI